MTVAEFMTEPLGRRVRVLYPTAEHPFEGTITAALHTSEHFVLAVMHDSGIPNWRTYNLNDWDELQYFDLLPEPVRSNAA